MDGGLAGAAQELTKVSAATITLAGVPALEYVVDAVRGDGLAFRQKSVRLVKNRKEFLLTFTAPRSRFGDADQTCLQEVLGSLTIQ